MNSETERTNLLYARYKEYTYRNQYKFYTIQQIKQNVTYWVYQFGIFSPP